MYKVVVTIPASNDLCGIKHYFDTIIEAPDVGKRILRKIAKSMQSLSDFPLRYAIRDSGLGSVGVRAVVVEQYMVLYVAEELEVNILRILHSSRDWARMI